MVGLGVFTQVLVADKDFPAGCANKSMGIPNMIFAVSLLYKTFFAPGTLDLFVSSVGRFQCCLVVKQWHGSQVQLRL